MALTSISELSLPEKASKLVDDDDDDGDGAAVAAVAFVELN